MNIWYCLLLPYLANVKLHEVWSLVDESMATALTTAQMITEELEGNESNSADNY